MSNYTKATNFTAKDGLPSGDSGKIVKGTEIDIEFTAIASAVSSKADSNSPAFTGTPTAPTASSNTNTTQLATTAFVTAALALLYPVGSIYINAAVSTNPNTLLGFGTWTAFGEGKVIVGLNSADALFDTLEETGGSKDAVVVSHTHTATVIDPGHNHNYDYNFGTSTPNNFATTQSNPFESKATSTATTGISVTNASTGVSATNANVQPFIVVKMWKRTA
jgi:hypothetical protein